MLNNLRLHQKTQIMSTTSSITVDGATQGVTITMLCRYISFSFSTLLVWDMLLTLKDEVRLLLVLLKLPNLHQRFNLSGQHAGLLLKGCSSSIDMVFQ